MYSETRKGLEPENVGPISQTNGKCLENCASMHIFLCSPGVPAGFGALLVGSVGEVMLFADAKKMTEQIVRALELIEV